MKRIWGLIPDEYKGGCVKLAALVPVKALLSLVGVAVLIPAMMVVLDPERLKYPPWIVIGGVIAVLLVKTALSLLITDWQNNFMMKLYRNLSSRLFISLYSRGLLFIKNQNSARMTFNVTGVCYNFVMSYLGGWLSLLGECCFVVLMLVVLFIYSAKAALMALCAFIPVIVLYFFTVRKPLRDINKKENDARREQNKLIFEAFRGYSEVQVNDAFPEIERRFKQGLDNISQFRVRSSIISTIPSYLLEVSVMAIVAVMLIFSMHNNVMVDSMFLGVFTVVLLKLLPAIRGIVSALTALNASEYTMEVISDIQTPATVKLHHDEDLVPMEFRHSIRVQGVSFQFEDDDKPVFTDMNLEIRQGSRFGIKGRTGSGKTTLFNILLGLYPCTEGQVLIDGVPLTVANVGSWHKIVGYVPQEVFVTDSTILENVALGYELSEIDRQKAEKALEQASLLDFVKALPKGLDTRIGEAGCKMSGGQRQRLGIARALYKNAQVLFFDEATSSLDSQTEKEVNEAIDTLSRTYSELTIIVISHRDSTLSFCDEIIQI